MESMSKQQTRDPYPYLGHNVQPAGLKVIIPKDALQEVGKALVKKASQVVPGQTRIGWECVRWLRRC
eukprot:scaffold189087_cov14-Tisochrysis_lutea.AAC.1